MTIAAARAEIVTKLEGVAGIGGRVHAFAPDSLNPPSAFVGTMTYNPRATLGDTDMTAQVWVAVSRAASSTRAAETLDAYIDGDTSVIDALEGVGTAWDSLAVTNVEFPVTITLGQGEYLAARFDCELLL